MDAADIRKIDASHLLVSGDLMFSTAKQLLDEGRRLIAAGPHAVIDFAGVKHCDSAGLALLLEWIDYSAVVGGKLKFRNLPDSLLGIARLSNVEFLLPIERT